MPHQDLSERYSSGPRIRFLFRAFVDADAAVQDLGHGCVVDCCGFSNRMSASQHIGGFETSRVGFGTGRRPAMQKLDRIQSCSTHDAAIWPGSCSGKFRGNAAHATLSTLFHSLQTMLSRNVVLMRQTTDHRTGSFAVVLGTNEIASAIGVHLSHAGYCVTLSHDPHPPVIRRKMAFHDALFADTTQVEDIVGERIDDSVQLFKVLRSPGRVLVTWLGLLDLLPIHQIDVLIDARLQKHRITPDLRRLARLAIGLGPGFSASSNCDVAVETRPGRIGLVGQNEWTDAADGVASLLGEVGAERFIYSPFAGRWHTPVEIGTRVYKDLVLGHLSGVPVVAPRDGILRGIVRDGSEVPAGVKLVEIDPRGRHAQWTGIDERGRAIAWATLMAVQRDIAHNAIHRSPAPRPLLSALDEKARPE